MVPREGVQRMEKVTSLGANSLFCDTACVLRSAALSPSRAWAP